MRSKKLNTSDVYDVNKKTGALILGKNRLEEYATKYLSKHCLEALITPMPLPVEKILQNENLTVVEAKLSPTLDVFGCCLLLDGTVEIYNPDTYTYEENFYPEGTILIDPDYGLIYGEGAKRNTLMHEALHWEKDKKYFDIKALRESGDGEEFTPILGRQSETFLTPSSAQRKDNEVKWLEWQCHRLAPRVLMPLHTFKLKAMELIEDEENDIGSCDSLIDALSEFFIASRSAVKYRLLEVGLQKQIEDYADFEDVYSTTLLSDNREFAKLSEEEALLLLLNHPQIAAWIKSEDYVFVDGYFIRNSTKYLRRDASGMLRLNAYAKKNLEKCVLLIQDVTVKDYGGLQKDLTGTSYLLSSIGTNKRIKVFDPKYQERSKIESGDEKAYHNAINEILADTDNDCQLIKLISDPTLTLCNALRSIMNQKEWTSSLFLRKTNLYQELYTKIKNNRQNNMKKETLLAICVGLSLSYLVTSTLMEKAGFALNPYQPPDSVYIRILQRYPNLGIDDFNNLLQAAGITSLKTKSRS